MQVRAATNHGFERVAFGGALLYVASIPLEGIVHLAGVGSFARVGGVVLLATAFFALVGGGMRVRRTDQSIVLFGMFVTWAVMSYFWSGDKEETLGRTVTNVQLLLAALVLWQYLWSRARVRVAVQAYVVGAFIASSYSLLVRQPHDLTGVERFSVGNPNSFGIEVVWAMLAAYWLLGQTASRRWKLFYSAFFVLGTIEVLATASRTALLTLGLAVVFAVADRRFLRPRNVAMAGALVAATTFAVLHFVSASQLERLGTLSEALGTGGNGRTTQWRLAFDVFTAHPVEGLGAAVFRDYSAVQIGISRVAHNSFLGVAADLGTVGAALFVGMFALAGRGLWRLPRTTRRLWFGLVAVWLVGASTLTWENQKFTYFVLVLMAAQSALATARVPELPLSPMTAAAAHQD